MISEQELKIESQYHQLLNLLLITLCKRLIKFYNNEECNEGGFKNALSQTLGNMKQLEFDQSKITKFSLALKPLEEVLFKPKELFIQTKSILKNNLSYGSNLGIVGQFQQRTPPPINNSRKRTHSISVTKRKEIEFRQQLLQLEEVQQPTNYFIRLGKKF